MGYTQPMDAYTMPPTGPQPGPEVPLMQPSPEPQSPLSAELADMFGGMPTMDTPLPPPEIPAQPEVIQTACHNCGELMEVTITQRPMVIACWKCGAEGMIE